MAHLNISVTMNMVENIFNPVLLAVWIIGCVAGLWWNLATTPLGTGAGRRLIQLLFPQKPEGDQIQPDLTQRS